MFLRPDRAAFGGKWRHHRFLRKGPERGWPWGRESHLAQRSRIAWVQVSAPPLAGCVALGNLLNNLSGLQFSGAAYFSVLNKCVIK